MNSLVKITALALAVSACAATTARAQEDSCKGNVHIDRVLSHALTGGHSFTYEISVTNLSAKSITATMQTGEFPTGVRLRANTRSIMLAPRGNRILPLGSGPITLDGVKVAYFYDIRNSMPQPWVLIENCKLK